MFSIRAGKKQEKSSEAAAPVTSGASSSTTTNVNTTANQSVKRKLEESTNVISSQSVKRKLEETPIIVKRKRGRPPLDRSAHQQQQQATTSSSNNNSAPSSPPPSIIPSSAVAVATKSSAGIGPVVSSSLLLRPSTATQQNVGVPSAVAATNTVVEKHMLPAASIKKSHKIQVCHLKVNRILFFLFFTVETFCFAEDLFIPAAMKCYIYH